MRNRLSDAVGQFNSEQFFECQDTLEDLWREERNETKRRFLQDLIQASVSFYHPLMADKGNLKGARSRFGKSLQKLEVFPTEYENLRVAELVYEWKKTFDNIGSGY